MDRVAGRAPRNRSRSRPPKGVRVHHTHGGLSNDKALNITHQYRTVCWMLCRVGLDDKHVSGGLSELSLSIYGGLSVCCTVNCPPIRIHDG